MSDPIHIALGPELPEFGSWNWLGLGLVKALSQSMTVTTFRDPNDPPEVDCIVFLKFKASGSRLAELRRRSALIYLPVDIYGSSHEIDSDAEALKCFDLVLLHSTRLPRYFSFGPRTEAVDHPLKFHLPIPREPVTDGPLLWIGRLCNLGPVVNWRNAHPSQDELWILTEKNEFSDPALHFGFRESARVRIGEWTEERHREWQAIAKAAVDVKGNDFRSRHKPPAKMLDFLASAVPVLTNRGSAPWLYAQSENLSVMDSDRWPDGGVPPDYPHLQRQAESLQELLTEHRVYGRYLQHIKQTWELWNSHRE